jgi:hypothetical protein
MSKIGDSTFPGFQYESGVMGESQTNESQTNNNNATTIRERWMVFWRRGVFFVISQLAYVYPPVSRIWKNIMAVDQTAGLPPNHGRITFPIIGWIWKRRNAERNIPRAGRGIT